MQLTNKDPGMDEHQFLCEVLETALAVDRPNLSHLQSREMVVRRPQIWEEICSESLRKFEAAGGYCRDADDRSLFLGHALGLGSALVAPTLTEFVSSRFKEKSGMLEGRRKAREERETLQLRCVDDDAEGKDG